MNHGARGFRTRLSPRDSDTSERRAMCLYLTNVIGRVTRHVPPTPDREKRPFRNPSGGASRIIEAVVALISATTNARKHGPAAILDTQMRRRIFRRRISSHQVVREMRGSFCLYPAARSATHWIHGVQSFDRLLNAIHSESPGRDGAAGWRGYPRTPTGMPIPGGELGSRW